jgi:hypothetical protein
VSNVLSEEKQKQVIALGQLGWTLRRIEKETGVRRETAAGYLRVAGALLEDGADGRRIQTANEAGQVTTDSGPPRPSRSPSASASLPYHELIEPFGLAGPLLQRSRGPGSTIVVCVCGVKFLSSRPLQMAIF